MAIALRVAVLVAAFCGYLLHYGMAEHAMVEGLKALNLEFVQRALDDFSIWFALPYLLLLTGVIFSTRLGLVAVVLAMGAVAYLDFSMYSKPNQDRGWYVVLSPLLLLIPAAFGLFLSAMINMGRKQMLTDAAKKPPKAENVAADPKSDV